MRPSSSRRASTLTERGGRISRRGALGAAGAFLLVTASACAGNVLGRPGTPPGGTVKSGVTQTTATSFGEPPVRASANGTLATDLEARLAPVTFGGHVLTTQTFEGTIPGPTLRVRPGDRVQLRLVNRLGEPTNLHFHGLHITPTGSGDNPFVHVAPNESFQYDFTIPADHPPGTYWYHPHLHGRVAGQVYGGLVGAIVVEGPIDRQPEIAAAHERLMVLKDSGGDAGGIIPGATMMDAMNGREGPIVTVNGALRPRLALRPGALERWRIVNAGNARYYRLAAPGLSLLQIATDAGPLTAPAPIGEVLLPPGKRVELLVSAPGPGTYSLMSRHYDRGEMTMMMGGGMAHHASPSRADIPLVDITAAGESVAMAPPATLTGAVASPDGPVAQRRTLELGETMVPGGARFMIDGKEFSPDRVDIHATLGTTEEWTIRNGTDMDHPFHLHVHPFQVVAIDGAPVAPAGWEDTVNVRKGQSVTLRIPFRDLPGLTVFHCHILEHEDLGMMGIVSVR